MSLPPDLATTVARAGIDPTAESRTRQAMLRAAIADRRGYVAWDVDADGWVVSLLSPDPVTFRGATLDVALAWCLVSLMTEELSCGVLA